jgi:hypothetical protein
MNFQDKTLTIALTHPEIMYFFDYEAKGKMFLLPIDTAEAATVLSSEFPTNVFPLIDCFAFRKCNVYCYLYLSGVYEE